jgi:serine/threonine-protein kinase
MATVYLARVTARAGFDRFVALKRIHPHLLKEPGFVEMFLDEARVASCIVHPNVCSVFDYEALGDRHYIAMEYLMGEPLSRVSHAMQERAGSASVERASYLVARIIADACEGLHAAHELRDSEGDSLKVVHRDVSPQNLFLTYDGAVKVVDFGLVRTAHCMHKTKTGIVKGKFAYLAPEALASKPLDRRADIWGLGVVLWELITQQRLFLRDSEADTVLAVATQSIEPPSVVRPGVPAALDKIVLKTLARDPAARYATARELGET